MKHYRVLIVDDDASICRLLGKFLGHLGYGVELAARTAEAIERLEHAYFDLVITDVRMPGPDGMELLTWVMQHRANTGVVMLSGCDDVRLAVRAMQLGALDYIVKPFEMKEVAATVSKAIGVVEDRLERTRHVTDLECTLAQQSGELNQTVTRLREASQETLEALVTALDARERETQAHSLRVAEYSARLASDMGVDRETLNVIRQGSMLHDIGKIGIPDKILLKPERLNEEEWVEMRKHPQIGAWIVGGVESLKAASGIVIAHHERFDGSGYPHQLSGQQIPLGARVFAVADSMDAILSDRPYRSGRSYEYAREEISRNSGSQFDPAVVDCFLSTPGAVWDRIRETSLVQQSCPVLAR